MGIRLLDLLTLLLLLPPFFLHFPLSPRHQVCEFLSLKIKGKNYPVFTDLLVQLLWGPDMVALH